MKLKRLGFLLLASQSISQNVRADQFHYNNILVGERAQGMGGAYGAIADDASGVFYNPAGLAFAQSNDISGSANAFYEKKTIYKSVLAGKDYSEKSSGTFAPFFGALQKVDKTISGLSVGFSYYAIDTGLRDQNDTFTNLEMSSTMKQERFHITANTRNNTFAFAVGAGYRMSTNTSVGLSVAYLKINELEQIYQDSQYYDSNLKYRGILTQNSRSALEAEAIEPGIGFQMALGSLSIGLSTKMPMSMNQVYGLTIESRTTLMLDGTDSSNKNNFEDGSADTLATGYVCAGLKKTETGYGVTNNGCTVSDGKIQKPLGTLPMQTRFGLAWFASQKFLLAYDAMYTAAVTDAKITYMKREAVLNHALGMEYYLTGSLPVRFGLFTNNSASPKMNATKYPGGQNDHINYLGTSLFLAFVQTNSQVALGGVYQKGSGDARKTGTAEVQKVESTAYTLALSATHSF